MAQLRKIKLLCQDLREGTRKIPVCHKLDIWVALFWQETIWEV